MNTPVPARGGRSLELWQLLFVFPRQMPDVTGPCLRRIYRLIALLTGKVTCKKYGVKTFCHGPNKALKRRFISCAPLVSVDY